MMLRKAVGAPTLAATRLVRCSARVISFCEGANAWRAISTASWGASGIAETRVRSAGCVGPGIPRVHGTQWLARRSLLSGTHTHRDDVAIDRSTSAANKAREAPADLTADGSQDFAHITTGLREYMIKTYKGTTKSVGIWMGTAAVCVPAGMFLSTISPVLPIGAWLGAAVYSVYKIVKLDSQSPTLRPRILDADKGIYLETDNPARHRNASKIMAGMGVVSSPIFLVAASVNPLIVPGAVALAVGSFGGATLAAMRRTDTDLIKWQAPLMGGVCALIGVTLVGSVASLAGFPVSLSALNIATSLGGILIFTGLTAADNHAIRAEYAEGQLDSAGHGLGLALSFVNIASDFMTLLAELFKGASD